MGINKAYFVYEKLQEFVYLLEAGCLIFNW